MVTANLNLWIEPDSGLFASQSRGREGSFPLLPQGNSNLPGASPLQLLHQINHLPRVMVNMGRAVEKGAKAVGNFFHAFG